MHAHRQTIIMEICKAPTLQLKALNKRTHIMHIEMENVIKNIYIKIKKYRHGVMHNYAKYTHTNTHTHTTAV